MPSLADLPVELLLDNVLPSIPLSGVLALGCTNRFFYNLTNDETMWKRRLQDDYNFDPSVTARKSGWKFIVRGLRNPKVFVWGESSAGRLGTSNIPRDKTYMGGVPAPMEIRVPGKRIVSLVPGGMSFHAIDSEGGLYVWGTLDGSSFALRSDGFSDRAKPAETPHRLLLPSPIRSITTGRLHATALTSNLEIYNFLSWGRPYRLVSHLLSTDPASPESPLQLESGWSFSSVLTRGGRVLVWWPFGDTLKGIFDREMEAMDNRIRNGETNLRAPAENDEIHCHVWDLQYEPLMLPEIPHDLPNLDPLHTGETEKERNKDPETRLIKIAGADNVLFGLTNRGHVLKYGGLTDDGQARQNGWRYLPEWSELDSLRQNAAYRDADNSTTEKLDPPSVLRITHISAHFNTFVAYSLGQNSTVLMNFEDPEEGNVPKVIPALQNRNIISVVLGDYFKAALTADGKLLTWGSFSKGALGLGHPKDLPINTPGGLRTERQLQAAQSGGPSATPADVETPTEVRFDWGKKQRKQYFCFSAAAAGWHMGALAISLEPDAEDESDDEVKMPGSYIETTEPPLVHPHRGPFEAPPFIPRVGGRGHGPWRIGLAGALGRGRGRGGQAGGDDFSPHSPDE